MLPRLPTLVISTTNLISPKKKKKFNPAASVTIKAVTKRNVRSLTMKRPFPILERLGGSGSRCYPALVILYLDPLSLAY
jgi:hypothetical protein